MIKFSSEEEVEEFFDKSDEFWQKDYDTLFFKKSGDSKPNIDDYYKSLTVKTRVVGFFFDKEEYKSEIKQLKDTARFLSLRENLRIGIVDDKKLVKKLKLKYGT